MNPSPRSKFSLYIVPLLLAIGIIAGCNALAGKVPGTRTKATVDPGADPIVVNAEAAAQAAWASVDLFVHLDADNVEGMRKYLPEAHAYAERLRREAPQFFNKYLDELENYIRTRDAASGDRMLALLTEIQNLAQEARGWSLRANAQQLKTAYKPSKLTKT
jgi:hypothetical protein